MYVLSSPSPYIRFLSTVTCTLWGLYLNQCFDLSEWGAQSMVRRRRNNDFEDDTSVLPFGSVCLSRSAILLLSPVGLLSYSSLPVVFSGHHPHYLYNLYSQPIGADLRGHSAGFYQTSSSPFHRSLPILEETNPMATVHGPELLPTFTPKPTAIVRMPFPALRSLTFNIFHAFSFIPSTCGPEPVIHVVPCDIHGEMDEMQWLILGFLQRQVSENKKVLHFFIHVAVVMARSRPIYNRDSPFRIIFLVSTSQVTGLQIVREIHSWSLIPARAAHPRKIRKHVFAIYHSLAIPFCGYSLTVLPFKIVLGTRLENSI
ncbi:hypothetical protein BD410DRAFT_552037 [Rickenella mellea]|uniref:Uncharacterized protein n=1 Tax=Rickenella mellea TaxID=50990 RepID=A0A4Y7PPG9_9AGAM|nr:hypothetical protein BD410DRAFT_552037 [Rickenella mellea]